MSFVKSIVVLSTVSLLSGCIVIASPSRADFHTQRQLNLDANAITTLDVDTGAGSLIIRGQQGLSEIKLTAEIYTSSDNKNNFDLELKKSGDTAYLVAKTPNSFGSWIGSSPHIDVVVYVPPAMMLDIDDGSGDIQINDIDASIEVNDGSGDLVISQVIGNVGIDDGSGNLIVNNVAGNIKIEDGSGNLTIDHANGMIDIEDGSGELTVNNVVGNVNVVDDSGEITLENISGSVDINDGSGDLTVRHVDGMVTVEDGSGDIDIETTGGLKILESGSGDLRVKDINGKLDIDS